MQSSEIKPGERVKAAHFTEDTLAVDLIDGRTIIVPLVWYPRLLGATAAQRQNRLVGSAGFGLHWPDIDEDLSTAGLLRGAPAAEPALAVGQAGRGMQEGPCESCRATSAASAIVSDNGMVSQPRLPIM